MSLASSLYTVPLVNDICLMWSIKKLPDNQGTNTAEKIIEEAYSYEGLGVYNSIEPSPAFPKDRVAENKAEYAALANKVKEREPRTILEIGTARGGSLFLWSRFFDSVSKICCIELGSHIDHFEERTRLFEHFADIDMEFIIADSHSQTTREETEQRFGNQSVDFLLIDGDHSYKGVKSDFEMYSKLVSDDGLIAFHDIVNEEWPGVGKFWNEIKPQFETSELIEDPECIGIGIIEWN